MRRDKRSDVEEGFEDAKNKLIRIIETAKMMLDGCNEILKEDMSGYLVPDNSHLDKAINALMEV